MKLYLVVSLLIQSIQVISSETFARGKASWDDDPRYDTTWVEPHDKVYALKGGEVLNPSETLKLLKVLEGKYVIRKDDESVSKLKDVEDLLSFAEIVEGPCVKPDETFKSIALTLRRHASRPNIVAFLKHYRDIQFSNCRVILNNNLQYDIELLPNSMRDALMKLKESVEALNPNQNLKEHAFMNLRSSLYFKPIEQLLENQLNPFFERVYENRNGLYDYNREFNNLIKEPCIRIALEKPIRITEYKFLAEDEEMLKKFDSFTMDWLGCYNICSVISADGEKYLNRIRDLILSDLLKYTRPPITVQEVKKTKKGCFSCVNFNS